MRRPNFPVVLPCVPVMLAATLFAVSPGSHTLLRVTTPAEPSVIVRFCPGALVA